MFPDDEVKDSIQDYSVEYAVLERAGIIAQEKYDEFVVQGGQAKGYNLGVLKGSLRFVPDLQKFENEYYLEGTDDHWTDVANYFEYGTGLYNTKRAGKYRAGYIRPDKKLGAYLTFVGTNKFEGKWVKTEKVKGVHPVFAMKKAEKHVQFKMKDILNEVLEEQQTRGD